MKKTNKLYKCIGCFKRISNSTFLNNFITNSYLIHQSHSGEVSLRPGDREFTLNPSFGMALGNLNRCQKTSLEISPVDRCRISKDYEQNRVAFKGLLGWRKTPRNVLLLKCNTPKIDLTEKKENNAFFVQFSGEKSLLREFP